MYRPSIICLSFAVVLLGSNAFSAEPKRVALEAIATLFIDNDLVGFKEFVAGEAIQGDGRPGSAIIKLQKQTVDKLRQVELEQVIFFGADDIERLAKTYPDDLWLRVEKHIGSGQGVLVKLALSGQAAERATAAGADPRDTAMMTFVVNDGPQPKIIHIDDN